MSHTANWKLESARSSDKFVWKYNTKETQACPGDTLLDDCSGFVKVIGSTATLDSMPATKDIRRPRSRTSSSLIASSTLIQELAAALAKDDGGNSDNDRLLKEEKQAMVQMTQASQTNRIRVRQQHHQGLSEAMRSRCTCARKAIA
eukprot:5494729-Pleurochrysis_carterae.AAC.4